MFSKALLCSFLAFWHVTALNLTNSNWIGTVSALVPIPGAITGFRRDFITPLGKTAVSAQILIAANNYTLYSNGEVVGQGSDWSTSEQFCSSVNPGLNVFAVKLDVQLLSPIVAFIGAIQVNYDDGSFDVILTNAAWLGFNNVVDGFQNIGFDDSLWLHAIIEGSLGSLPGGPPKISSSPYNASSVSLNGSYYIWTNDMPSNDPYVTPPPGSHAFRKILDIPGGTSISSGTAVFFANNAFTAYINGKLIGSGSNGEGAKCWNFTLDNSTSHIVVAVNATVVWEPYAAFIGAVVFNSSDSSCSGGLPNITTDSTWKFSSSVPTGFEQPNFNDSDWSSVVAEGLYGIEPYGILNVTDVK